MTPHRHSPGTYPSPLRYPGGKAKVANFLKLLLLTNELVDVQYVEPYAGGAGVALALLYEDFVDSIVINDTDPGLFAFWSSAINHSQDLCELVRHTPVTVEEWDRQRAIYTDECADELAFGFATFFLNRTNRSGIIHDGGVIGGKRQTGPWKIGARYEAEALVARLQKIARFRNRITVSNRDAAELLGALGHQTDTFFYLDPPYYVKGAELYTNSYSHQDHVGIASLVAGMSSPWLVSYDAASQIRAMYSDFRSLAYSLSYSARERRLGSEVMFFCDSLNLPDVTCPASVSLDDVNTARGCRVVKR